MIINRLTAIGTTEMGCSELLGEGSTTGNRYRGESKLLATSTVLHRDRSQKSVAGVTYAEDPAYRCQRTASVSS